MSTNKDAAPTWGPKMAALPNDKWRAFVVALYSPDAPRFRSREGEGLLNWAVKQAGFGETTNRARSTKAQILKRDKRVIEAAAEYAKSVMTVDLTPEAIKAVRECLGNPKSKHHAKMVAAVLDRTMPIPKAPMVQIDNTMRIEVTGDQMLSRFRELAAKYGVDPDALLAAKPAEMAEMRAKLIEAKSAPDAELRP